MTTFVRAFNTPTVKLQILVKLGINFMQTYEGKCIRYMINYVTCVQLLHIYKIKKGGVGG